jgi:hypothetical protein
MAAKIFRHRRRSIFKNNPDRDGWKTDQTDRRNSKVKKKENMKKQLIIELTLIVTLAALLMPAKANTPLDFVLYNETGDTIVSAYVSAHGYSGWGQNWLRTPLETSDYTEMGFSQIANTRYYDIRVVFPNGDTSDFEQGFDLLAVKAITLFFDGNGTPIARSVY